MPGSWTIVHAPARFAVNLMLLLTDGRVLAFEGGGSRCATLTPDLHGSYEDGFWDERASMTHSRLYFESAVFADGGVYVGGGEYGTGNVSVELYDPVTDHWRDGQLPPWPYLSDEPCCLLSDGTLLAGFQQRSGIYSPTTDSWTKSLSRCPVIVTRRPGRYYGTEASSSRTCCRIRTPNDSFPTGLSG